MGSGPNWYQNGSKICYIPIVSIFSAKESLSMLTGLKVSYLGCKCVFYRPKHNAKGRPHRIEF